MTSDDLRRWRAARNLTQAQAAALVALTFRGYQAQEVGARPVSRQTERVVELLGQLEEMQPARDAR